MTLTIEQLVIPQTLDDSHGDDFIRAMEILNEVEALTYGTPDLAYASEEELPYFHDTFYRMRLLVARVDGEIVGVTRYETGTDDEADTSWIGALVLPAYRRQGIGSALIRGLEDFARADERPKAVVYHGVVDLPGEQLVPPTGSGSVPADDAAVRFLLKHGCRLEQVERLSRLALPVPDLQLRLAAAIAETGADYRLQHWIGPTPERWLEDIAVLGNRMSTDAPSAGLEEPEETWTVERVLAADERDKASPRSRFVAAAEHVSTGRLAGFTVLSVPRQPERSVAQYATLVLREHRGHRLGMLLKVANLVQLEEHSGGHPSVTTFNAEENRHMLSVNEALGFVPIASEGAWRKDLGE